MSRLSERLAVFCAKSGPVLFKIGIAASVILLAGYALFLFAFFRPRPINNFQTDDYEINPSAFVLFSPGKIPGAAEVKVIDLSGAAVSSATVDIRAHDGGQYGKTDAEGHALIPLKDKIIIDLSLNGQIILDRTNNAVVLPALSNGVHILIVRKDRPPAVPKPSP